VSSLVGAGAAVTVVVPPLAVRMGIAAGMLACLGGMALAKDAVSCGLLRPAIGAALGAVVVWQSWRLLHSGPRQKDGHNRAMLDVEAQASLCSGNSLERSPPAGG
jgi:uncharacterized membrane protein YccC